VHESMEELLLEDSGDQDEATSNSTSEVVNKLLSEYGMNQAQSGPNLVPKIEEELSAECDQSLPVQASSSVPKSRGKLSVGEARNQVPML